MLLKFLNKHQPTFFYFIDIKFSFMKHKSYFSAVQTDYINIFALFFPPECVCVRPSLGALPPFRNSFIMFNSFDVLLWDFVVVKWETIGKNHDTSNFVTKGKAYNISFDVFEWCKQKKKNSKMLLNTNTRPPKNVALVLFIPI